MTELDITALSNRLLSGVRDQAPCDAPARRIHTETSASSRISPAHRRGYAMFKIILGLSLFFGAFALVSWSRALAGSPLGIETAGYVYLSVPLKATQLQTDQTVLRLDIMGAGIHLLRFEMAQNSGTARLLTKSRRRDWRAQRALLGRQDVPPIQTARQPKKAGQNPSSTRAARTLYLSLLRAYQHETSAARRRALHRKLKAAYQQAAAPAP